uniref:Replication termination factor 2 n=2 Tax=Cyprinus carpio TaxID=7962 RepID=A0A9J7XSG9_CYPCA
MGCDGGTIPKRHELVKGPKKVEKVDKNAELAAKWRYCALSQEKLKRPIVACELGRLYNKDAIIEYLLDKSAERPNSEVVAHIRSIKEVKELNLTDNPAWEGERHNIKGDCYEDMHCSMFICPVVGLEMNGKHKFLYLPTCGCVFSERALKESKTEIMIFGPNYTLNKISNIDLGPLVPYVKSTVKNLGVIMDTDFKLDEQINSVVRSSFCRLRLLSKVKPFLSFNDFVRLIHVFISSLLDYCNALYVGVNQASLSCLQLVQNAAARLLTRTRKREHILPILSSLHWLPFRFRIDFTVLLFAYKSLNGLAPTYLSDLIQLHVPSRSLRSADHMLLTFPRVRLKHRGDRAFAVAAPKLWNSLPLSVRMAPNLSAFKTSLKTYFYSLAFNTV